MIKFFAVRETPAGYRLCEVETVKTNFGGTRKYSHDINLIYKRKDFAIKKAHDFYNELWNRYSNTTPVFYGVIGYNDFKGEEVTL
jgi:hypothetical protein